MAGEIVFVSSPVSDFVGKISPDDSIFVEWQLDHSQVFIKMLDGLVGDDHADDEEEDKRESSATCKYPVLSINAPCQSCYRCENTQMRQQVVEEEEGAHRLDSVERLE